MASSVNLLLIDSRVPDINGITDSLTWDTDYIIFDYNHDTFESIKQQITKPYANVGLVQHNYQQDKCQILGVMTPATLTGVEETDPNLTTWDCSLNKATYTYVDVSSVQMQDKQEPVLDASGEPVILWSQEYRPMMVDVSSVEVDVDGQPVLDASGDPVLVWSQEEQMVLVDVSSVEMQTVLEAVVDEDGNAMMDTDGNTIMQPVRIPVLDASGEPVIVWEQQPVENVETTIGFFDFLRWLKENGAEHVDFLACYLWKSADWRYIIEKVRTDWGVWIRASIDLTGWGGNFILESDGADMIGVYFTEGIWDYKYAFIASTPQVGIIPRMGYFTVYMFQPNIATDRPTYYKYSIDDGSYITRTDFTTNGSYTSFDVSLNINPYIIYYVRIIAGNVNGDSTASMYFSAMEYPNYVPTITNAVYDGSFINVNFMRPPDYTISNSSYNYAYSLNSTTWTSLTVGNNVDNVKISYTDVQHGIINGWFNMPNIVQNSFTGFYNIPYWDTHDQVFVIEDDINQYNTIPFKNAQFLVVQMSNKSPPTKQISQTVYLNAGNYTVQVWAKARNTYGLYNSTHGFQLYVDANYSNLYSNLSTTIWTLYTYNFVASTSTFYEIGIYSVNPNLIADTSILFTGIEILNTNTLYLKATDTITGNSTTSTAKIKSSSTNDIISIDPSNQSVLTQIATNKQQEIVKYQAYIGNSYQDITATTNENLFITSGVYYNTSDKIVGNSSIYIPAYEYAKLNTNFQISASGFSICFWYKYTPSTTTPYIIRFTSSSTTNDIGIGHNAGQMNLSILKNGAQTDYNLYPLTAVSSINEWNHYSLVFEPSGMMYTFVNGSLNQYISCNFPVTTPTYTSIQFGGYFNTSLQVDDFRIYNGTILTSTQVLTVFNYRGDKYLTEQLFAFEPTVYCSFNNPIFTSDKYIIQELVNGEQYTPTIRNIIEDNSTNVYIPNANFTFPPLTSGQILTATPTTWNITNASNMPIRISNGTLASWYATAPPAGYPQSVSIGNAGATGTVNMSQSLWLKAGNYTLSFIAIGGNGGSYDVSSCIYASINRYLYNTGTLSTTAWTTYTMDFDILVTSAYTLNFAFNVFKTSPTTRMFLTGVNITLNQLYGYNYLTNPNFNYPMIMYDLSMLVYHPVDNMVYYGIDEDGAMDYDNPYDSYVIATNNYVDFSGSTPFISDSVVGASSIYLRGMRLIMPNVLIDSTGITFSLWQKSPNGKTLNDVYMIGIFYFYTAGVYGGFIAIQGYNGSININASTEFTHAGGVILYTKVASDYTNWMHIVVNYTGTTARYYINNSLVRTDTLASTVLNKYINPYIGGIDSNHASFQLDDFQFFRGTLNATTISKIYKSSPNNSDTVRTYVDTLRVNEVPGWDNSGCIAYIVNGKKIDQTSTTTYDELVPTLPANTLQCAQLLVQENNAYILQSTYLAEGTYQLRFWYHASHASYSITASINSQSTTVSAATAIWQNQKMIFSISSANTYTLRFTITTSNLSILNIECVNLTGINITPLTIYSIPKTASTYGIPYTNPQAPILNTIISDGSNIQVDYQDVIEYGRFDNPNYYYVINPNNSILPITVVNDEVSPLRNGVYDISSSSYQTPANILQAFDNDTATSWITNATYSTITGNYTGSVSTSVVSSTSINGDWIQIKLPSSIICTYFSFTSLNANTAVSLVASNNESTWYLIGSGTNSTSNISKTYKLNNNVSYQFYRLIITSATTENGSIRLSQVSIYANNTSGKSGGLPITSRYITINSNTYTLNETNTASLNGNQVNSSTNATMTTTASQTYNSRTYTALSPESTTTTIIVPPSAPIINSITAGNNTLTIDFTAGENGGFSITGYKYNLNGGNFIDIGLATSPYTVTGLTNGTSYTITLKAYNIAGDSVASSSLSATPITVPTAPTLVSLTPGNTTISMAFTAPTNNGGSAITGYKYNLNGGAFVDISMQSSPYTITGLTNGTAYTITLKAYNSAGDSTASSSLASTPRTVPDAPTITSLVNGNKTIKVYFTAGSNGGSAITGYRISKDNGVSYTNIGLQSSPYTITTGLTVGTTYTILLKAYNALGDSTVSNSSSLEVKSVPSSPIVNYIKVEDSKISIYFTEADNGGSQTLGYKYSIDNITYNDIGLHSSPYQITGLTNETEYYVKFKQYNAIGDSNEAEFTSSATVKPYSKLQPSLNRIDTSGSTATLYWNYAEQFRVNIFADTGRRAGFTMTTAENVFATLEPTNTSPIKIHYTGDGITWNTTSISTPTNVNISGRLYYISNTNSYLFDGVKDASYILYTVPSITSTNYSILATDDIPNLYSRPVLITTNPAQVLWCLNYRETAIHKIRYASTSSITTWLEDELPNINAYYYVIAGIWANGKYYLLTNYGYMIEGTIGSWTYYVLPNTDDLYQICYSPSLNKICILCGYFALTTKVGGSTSSWTETSIVVDGIPMYNSWESLIWVEKLGLFVATNNLNTYISRDGDNWQTYDIAIYMYNYTNRIVYWSDTLNAFCTTGYITTSNYNNASIFTKTPSNNLQYTIDDNNYYNIPATQPALLTNATSIDKSLVKIRFVDKIIITNTSSVSNTVFVKPDPPTIDSIVSANSSLVVSFTDGNGNGNTIIGHKYSLNGGATYIDISNVASPFTITGLTNGTTYTVELIAYTSTDDSSPSISVSATPYGIPNAPTITSLTAGNMQISMSFTPPVNTGGLTITGYKYNLNDGSFVDIGLQTSPYVITGLTNGTAYTIKLKAYNSAGESTASSSLSTTPYTVPDAPTLVSLTPDKTTISVEFTSPVNDGGSAITGYKISTNGGATYTNIGLQTSPYTITGLTNYTEYMVALKAYNSAGDSVATATLTTYTVPRYPTIVDVIGENLSATVTFYDGSYSGYSVASYSYMVDSSNVYPVDTIAQINGSQNKWFTVPNLLNGTTYTIHVIATYTNNETYTSPVATVIPYTELTNTLTVAPSNQKLDYTLSTTSIGSYPFVKYQYSFMGEQWVDISALGSTNSNLINGAIIDTVTYKTGNASLYLDNSASNPATQYFRTSTFRMSNGGLTFAFWIKTSSPPDVGYYKSLMMFATSDSGTNNYINASIQNYLGTYLFRFDFRKYGVLYSYPFNGYNLSGVFNDQWHHICFTIEPDGKYKLYIDTALVITKTGGIYPAPYLLYSNSSTSFQNTIGNNSGIAYALTGHIDDFRFYNGRLLSQNEITALYNYTAGDIELNNDPTLTIYEQFDKYYFIQSTVLPFEGLTNGTEYTLYVKSDNVDESAGIRNADFTEEIIPANTYKYLATGTTSPPDTSMAGDSGTYYGWNYSGGAVISSIATPSLPAGYTQYLIHNIAPLSLPVCTTSQEIYLTAGNYTLSFYAIGSNTAYSSTHTLTINISDASYNTGAISTSQWTHYSYNFSTSSNTTKTLLFTSSSTANSEIGITGIKVSKLNTKTISLAGIPYTVPDAPTIVSLTPANTSIIMTFTAPANNGGSAITSYSLSKNGGTSYTDIGLASSPYTITGLTNGVSYTILLKANNIAGSSIASTSLSATPKTVPSAPTLTSVSAGNASITVAFSGSSSNGGTIITGYKISIDGGVSYPYTGIKLNQSPYTISGLTNGTTYTVTMKATNAVGDSVASGSLSATPRTVPSAPTITSLTAGNMQISMAFTAPASNGGSPIIGYRYKLNGGDFVDISMQTSPYTISGLTNGTSYSVVLVAYNEAGTSLDSVAVISTPRTVPDAPTITAVVSGNQHISVSFSNGSNGGSAILGYKYSLNDGQPVDIGLVSSPYDITGLTNGTSYSLKMLAYNVAGNSSYSNVEYDLIPYSSATAPYIDYATYSNAENILSIYFEDPSNNGGSQIAYYQYSFNGSTFVDVSGKTSPLVISTALAYPASVSIKAVNEMYSISPVSNTRSIIFPPSTPHITSVVSGDQNMFVYYTQANNGGSTITSYKYTLNSSGVYTTINSTANPLIIGGLTNDVSYNVAIKATNAYFDSSASNIYSNIIPSSANATNPDAPTMPTITNVIYDGTTMYIYFNAPSSTGATQIIKYNYYIDSVKYTYSATLTSPLTITATLSYPSSVYIDAENSNGESPISNIQDIIFAPSAPVITNVASGNQSLTVYFSEDNNGGSEIVNYHFSIDGGLTYTVDVSANDASGGQYTITGLTNGTQYVVTMKTENAYYLSAVSNQYTQKPYTAPSAPVIISVVAGNQEMYVYFSQANDGGDTIIAYKYSLNDEAYYSVLGATSPIHITGLTNGNTYAVKIIASNSLNSQPSNEWTGIVPYTAPSTPTITSIATGNGELAVYFTQSSTGGLDISGYKYQLNSGEFVATTQTTSPLTITGLTNGEAYTVAIKAYHLLDSSASATSAPYIPHTYPYAPVITDVVIGLSQVSVYFTQGFNGGMPILGYKYSLNSGAFVAVDASSSPLVIPLTAGVQSVVAIKAYNSHGESTSSNTSASFMAYTYPSAPFVYSLVGGYEKLTVKFIQDSSGYSPITGYKYSLDGGATYTSTTHISSPFDISAGITVGTPYSVKLIATTQVDSSASLVSNTAVSYTKPTSPSITNATYFGGQMTLTFTPPDNTGGLPIAKYSYAINNGQYDDYYKE